MINRKNPFNPRIPMPPVRPAASFLTICMLIFLLISCVTMESGGGKKEKPDNSEYRKSPAETEKIKKALVEAAGIYHKSQNLLVGDRKFNMDCSGVVSAIYYYAGIDLQKYYPKYEGTGTERIYSALEERKLLNKYWLPEPGDIIFWDNTFDKNSNGKDDDRLTHIGMVVSCDKQGNIVYIHHHYQLGIVYEKMNLRYKNYHSRSARGQIVTINSPLREKGGSREQKNWLSGQLFNSFGEAYHL